MSRISTFFIALVGGLVALAPLAHADAPQCINGGDGHAACGYHCTIGGNGVARCSNVPFGACMNAGNGQAVCFIAQQRLPADSPPAQCINGGDGSGACGYHCIQGGDNHAVCAGAPWGTCGRGGDGKVVCFP